MGPLNGVRKTHSLVLSYIPGSLAFQNQILGILENASRLASQDWRQAAKLHIQIGTRESGSLRPRRIKGAKQSHQGRQRR